MPSGADLEYARMLAQSGQTSGAGLDGARLAQMGDENLGIFSDVLSASSGVRAALVRAQRSVSIQVAGCSTSDGPTDWPRVLASMLSTMYSRVSINFHQWDDATQRYVLPESVSVGSAGAGFMDLIGGGLATTPVTITGDLDLRIKVRVPVWAPGSGNDRDLIGQSETGRRNFLFELIPTGKLRFAYTTDGVNTVFTDSTAVVPFANNSDGWLRVVHDVDNGATGNSIKFYTSTDGTNWTQLGTTITYAGIVTRFAAPTTDLFTLGCREASNPSRTFTGRIYYVQVLAGIDGYDVAPNYPDMWRQVTLYTSMRFEGSPVLAIYNASVAGQSSAYHNNATRRPKELFNAGQRLFILDTGHNESQVTWQEDITSYLSNVQTLLPLAPRVVIAPNAVEEGSITAPTQQEVEFRSTIGANMLSLAANIGAYPIDIWPVLSNPSVETSDGLHPTASGQKMWASYLTRVLFGKGI